MYAVISDRGRQYCVQEGQTLAVDVLPGEPNATVEFAEVLLIGGGENAPSVGSPTVPNAKVVAEIVGDVSGPKIHVGVYKKRKNYRKHRGHRQPYTEIRIKQIVA